MADGHQVRRAESGEQRAKRGEGRAVLPSGRSRMGDGGQGNRRSEGTIVSGFKLKSTNAEGRIQKAGSQMMVYLLDVIFFPVKRNQESIHGASGDWTAPQRNRLRSRRKE